MIKNSKILVYSSIYVLIILVNVFAILSENTLLTSVFKPLIVFAVLLMYLKNTKAIKQFYLVALICVLIGDIFYLFETKYFLIAMLFYTMNHFAITIEIFKFKKAIRIKNMLLYFLLLCLALAIVYLYVLKDQEGHDVSILLFGISLCVLTASALVNYLRNMTSPNFYLMLGMLLSFLTNLIISLNAFNLSSAKLINLFGTLFLAITHYTILYSFLIRKQE